VVPVEAKIFYRAPDWITIRTYGPMGIKLVEASLQKNRFQVYSLFTNEFFSGNLDSVNLATRFKLPLPNMDMRTAWQRLFNYTRPQETQIEVRNSGKFYILSYTQEQNLHEIWVDSRKMLVERENLLDSTGVLQYYTAYSRYKKRSGVRFPRHIEMGDIARGVKLKIEISDFKLNSSVSDADMMLSVPLEAKRVEL
jgi:outer membrane lipoprotein-sorting protein